MYYFWVESLKHISGMPVDTDTLTNLELKYGYNTFIKFFYGFVYGYDYGYKKYDKKNHPTNFDVDEFLKRDPDSKGHSWYTAREHLRNLYYGGKAPDGWHSWGDYNQWGS